MIDSNRPGYLYVILRKAWIETGRVIEWKRRAILFAIGAYVISFLIDFWRRGWGLATDELLISLVYGFAGPIMVVITLFLINLLRSPVLIYKENQDRILELEEKLNTKPSRSLFIRLKFLDEIETGNIDEIEASAHDLVEFVSQQQSNDYFSKKIAKLTLRPHRLYLGDTDTNGEDEEDNRRYREQLISARNEIRRLIDELVNLKQ